MDTINLIARVSREKEPDAHESFLKLRGKERDTMRKRPSLLLTARLLCKRNKETRWNYKSKPLTRCTMAAVDNCDSDVKGV